MGRLALVLGCGLAASCAQLAGIEQTSGGSDAVDAGPPTSTLTFDRYSVGATIVQAPLPVAGLELPTFFVGDTAVPGVVRGDATWGIDQLATSVLFHLPDSPASIPRVLQVPAPTVRSLFGLLEHPGAQPPAATSSLNINLALPTASVAGEAFQLLVVGAWSQADLPVPLGSAAIVTAPAYSTFTSLTGRPLDAISASDAVIGMRHTGNKLTAEVDLPGFAQTDGSDSVTGTLVALGGATSLNVTIHAADGLARLAKATPAPTTVPSLVWALNAAPGYAIASTSGPLLDAVSVPADSTSIASTYDNPFVQRGWHTTLTWVVHQERPYTATAGAMAGIPINLIAQLHTIREPGDGQQMVDATFDAGLPTAITLGATPLITDGLVIADDPAMPIAASFTADVTSNTLYQLQLLEGTLGADGKTIVVTTTLAYTGVTPGFTIPAGTLAMGHTYWLRAVCLAGGFPALASGDLTQRALPLSVGIQDSGVFTMGTPP